MNREDILRMAIEAGLIASEHNGFDRTSLTPAEQRFATIVAAHVRDRCAQIAESYEPRCDACPSGVANAIRARGNT